MTDVQFPATRAAALDRLADFAPKAGRDYAAKRNFDLPGHRDVSRLSPYLRHRVLTEEEVLASVLARHTLPAAEKFVQEVVWRTYFKGWLEHRPQVWTRYRQDLRAAVNRVQTEAGLRGDWEAACRGETGIDAFDHWARELARTGYLHNHARMWFASIWIFTLRLPWELGADFFLRHLLDGDPASNTLGWRWVAGLHTVGKHYVAQSANIARYTQGRFHPVGLAEAPEPLTETPPGDARPLRAGSQPRSGLRTGLLLTEDDLSPDFALPAGGVTETLILNGAAARSPLAVSENVRLFTEALIDDCVARYDERFGKVSRHEAGETAPYLVAWAERASLEQVILPYRTVGPADDSLRDAVAALDAAGIAVAEPRRAYDSAFWPSATAGFFKVKKTIPRALGDLGLVQPRQASLL